MTRLKRALRSKTAGDSAWGLADQAAMLLATTLSAFLLIHRLGAAGYGAYAATYALMAPFLAFIQSGVGLAVMDSIVREKHDPDRVIGAYLGYVAAASVLLWALVSSFVGSFIHGMPVVAGALFIGTDYVIVGAATVTTSAVQAVRGYRFAAQTRIVLSVARACILVLLAVVGRLSLFPLALTQACTFALLAVLLHRWHERLLGLTMRPRRFGRGEVRHSGVYAVGLSAISTQNSYDQVVLKATSLPLAAEPGQYAAAYRMVSLGLLPMAAIASATHTEFLEVSEGRNDQVARAARLSKLGAAYSIVFCAAAFVCAPLVPRIFGAEFEGTETIIRLLAPLVPLRGITTFPMNGLLGLGRNGLRTKILIGSAVLSLVLYASLIPSLSWKGAVIGTLISESLLFLAAWAALFRCQMLHDEASRPMSTVG